MQKVSRVENHLMIHLNNMRLQSNNINTQSNVSSVIASVLPAAAVVAVPESQTIVRDIDTPLPESISDSQRAKLKALKTLADDGVLSFNEYQQIKKDTLASSSTPSAPPQAQVVVVNDVDNSNNENRSIADEIKKLKELHSSGVLSDEEFKQAKASTLASFSKCYYLLEGYLWC